MLVQEDRNIDPNSDPTQDQVEMNIDIEKEVTLEEKTFASYKTSRYRATP